MALTQQQINFFKQLVEEDKFIDLNSEFKKLEGKLTETEYNTLKHAEEHVMAFLESIERHEIDEEQKKRVLRVLNDVIK